MFEINEKTVSLSVFQLLNNKCATPEYCIMVVTEVTDVAIAANFSTLCKCR